MLARSSTLLLLVTMSPALPEQVDRPSDVLHPSLVKGVRELGKRLMQAAGSEARQRLYVIVNPALQGEDPKRLEAAIERWGGRDRQLPDAIKQALKGAGDIPPLYHVLRKISYQFIRLAFDENVLEVKSIRQILRDAAPRKEAIVVSVDGRCRRAREQGAIEVELSLRVHRLELAKARAARIELIYMDQASGVARLPSGQEGKRPPAAGPGTLKTLEAAAVDALNRKIGHSLLVNPRVVGASWVESVRAEGAKVVEASINRRTTGDLR
ncbi:MAG: hypothetical protein ACE5F1_18880 [Planctomycetota bacterium]